MNKPMLYLAICLFALSLSSQDRKLTAEDLISRHLESIGKAEARSKITARVASGQTNLIARIGGAANLDGQAMMVSTGPKLRLGLKFSLTEYTGEDMAFDGNRAATGFLPQGRRSGLSNFLNSQNLPLKEGLIGGVLSTAWPLLRVDQTQPRLDYRGLKKVDGRQLHEVGYRARKGGGDLKVLLYFEPETFRHVHTRYSFEIAASVGTREDPNRNTESYYTLTEDFDEFRAVDGLMLPHKYRLQYSSEGRAGSALHDWTVTMTKISHNEKLDDQLFIIR
ncbi:MAG: hypothetical protein MOB07_10900 [Acidobacteria bacterium]|nr:hypothetical protein [Acidobacteriota bacterium]